MISIKKYLDMERLAPDPVPGPKGKSAAEDIATPLSRAYVGALDGIANNAEMACPAVGVSLRKSMTDLAGRVMKAPNVATVQEIERKVRDHLNSWGAQAASYFKEKAEEVKELLIAMARTAESIGERDQRYCQQLNQFTRELQGIADLEDLGQIRGSLVKKVTDLKVCVDQMTADNQRAMAQLKAEVSVHETRAREAEEVAATDELTGLLSRRSIERRIETALEAEHPFCVLMLDLNGFKQVNDTYGHAAGDALLKQFAGELRHQIRATDTAGRWGGDEFVVLLDCGSNAARAQIERIEKWVFGDYTLPAASGKEPTKVHVQASIGLSERDKGDTLKKLLERADQAMYREKKKARTQHA